MKPFNVVLALCLLGGTVPLDVLAASPQEERDYAEREAQSPALADFEGGIHEILIFLVVVAAIAFLVYWIFIRPSEHYHPSKDVGP